MIALNVAAASTTANLNLMRDRYCQAPFGLYDFVQPSMCFK
ncbi:MAG: hypothetical protein WAU42_11355 [Solirubrobacteraceae bacterium]